MVLQHALGNPPMRRGLALLSGLWPGEVYTARLAMLEDRVHAFEGRPHRYGTQYNWEVAGGLGPLPIEDPERLDEWRRSVGLGPLEGNTRRIREQTSRVGERQPSDWADRQRREWEWEPGPAHTFSLMEKTLRNWAETPEMAWISGVRTRQRSERAANTVLREQSPNHRKTLKLALFVEATLPKSFDDNT